MNKTIKKLVKLFIKCYMNVSAFLLLCYLLLRGFDIMVNTDLRWVGVIMITTALSAAATQAVWVARKI